MPEAFGLHENCNITCATQKSIVGSSCLPPSQMPEAFGLHENCNITCATQKSIVGSSCGDDDWNSHVLSNLAGESFPGERFGASVPKVVQRKNPLVQEDMVPKAARAVPPVPKAVRQRLPRPPPKAGCPVFGPSELQQQREEAAKQSKDAKECGRLQHCKDLRTQKEVKEAKKLEAAGKAPPIRRHVDGHPEHLLHVSPAQNCEDRKARFQKQSADKGLERRNGGISKEKGKADGKGDLFNEGSALNQSPSSNPAWQQPAQHAYGSGNCFESHSRSFRYTNGHGNNGVSGSAGGGWWAPEAASTNWQGPNWPASSSWAQRSWSGWRAENLAWRNNSRVSSPSFGPR
eukprot:s8176_g2.t1